MAASWRYRAKRHLNGIVAACKYLAAGEEMAQTMAATAR